MRISDCSSDVCSSDLGGAISKCAHLGGGFLARTVAQILLRQIDDQSELHNAILPIPSATGCRTCTVYGCCLSTPRAILTLHGSGCRPSIGLQTSSVRSGRSTHRLTCASWSTLGTTYSAGRAMAAQIGRAHVCTPAHNSQLV